MASSYVVPVARIENVREHPNAVMLSIANVLGYQMVSALIEDPEGPIVRKFMKDARDEKDRRVPWDNVGTVEEVRYRYAHAEGEKIVYFPADSILPNLWIELFGVRNYMKGRDKNRVGRIRLRGEPSFGLVVDLPEGIDWEVGDNVAEHYGATKYEPPVKATCGDAAAHDSEIDPLWEQYTDIENGRIFVDVFKPGEEVVATEKLHGTNARIGYVNGTLVAGSMKIRRKFPDNPDQCKRSTYWFPFTIDGVASLLKEFSHLNVAILFGEVFGPVQNLHYGLKNLGFRAFDLYLDGKYVDYDEFASLCDKHNVPRVPELFRGKFDGHALMQLADGPSVLPNADHIREGIVVKPVRERTDPKVGRAILKYIGIDYQLSKKKDDIPDI